MVTSVSGTAAEHAAELSIPPEVQSELKHALPQVAAEAVQAIIVEVPSYAEARDYLVGNIESAVQVALGSFLTMAARSDDPSSPLGPARQASYALGRGEARSGRSMDALLSAYRIGARVSWRELSAVAVRAGMSAPLLAQFAELVFAYIDELSAASVAGHADELATAERSQERRLERLALDLVRGASEEVSTRRAAACRVGSARHDHGAARPGRPAAPGPRHRRSPDLGPRRGPAGPGVPRGLRRPARARPEGACPATSAAVPARLRRRARTREALVADGLLLPARTASRASGCSREPNQRQRHTTRMRTWPSWC